MEATTFSVTDVALPVGVAETIYSIKSVVAERHPGPEVKQALTELVETVGAMLVEGAVHGRLSGADQEVVARDLKVLADEAVSATPRLAWMSLAGQSLVERASGVEREAAVASATSSVLCAAAFTHR